MHNWCYLSVLMCIAIILNMYLGFTSCIFLELNYNKLKYISLRLWTKVVHLIVDFFFAIESWFKKLKQVCALYNKTCKIHATMKLFKYSLSILKNILCKYVYYILCICTNCCILHLFMSTFYWEYNFILHYPYIKTNFLIIDCMFNAQIGCAFLSSICIHSSEVREGRSYLWWHHLQWVVWAL